mgnify:CR=1 FL=1
MINCCVIGLGQIGMEYDLKNINHSIISTHAKAIDRHSKFRLVGGVDISPRKRKRFEKHYNLPTFNDVQLALESLNPDLIVIATPTEFHSEILSKAVSSPTLKIILCEKPLAYEIDEAKNMVKLCEKANIKLFVNYMRRVDKGVIKIKKWIKAGKIKTPIKANVWYSKGIFNNGSHFLNLLEMWLGNVNSISISDNGRLWNNFDPEPDFNVKFDLGSATFNSAWEESFSHYSIELISRSGRLFYDYGGKHIEFQSIIDDTDFKGYKILHKKKEIINNSMNISQLNVYDNIHKDLNDRPSTICTGLQALKTLKGIQLIVKQRQRK